MHGYILLALIEAETSCRMMSDHSVVLNNEENLHDFFVKFKGPKGSTYMHMCILGMFELSIVLFRPSSIRRWNLEGACEFAERISVQIAIDRLCEPFVPSKC